MTKHIITPWHEWFAWHPVRIDETCTFPDGAYLHYYRTVWLKTIWRRRVLSMLLTGEQCLHWEYKDKHIFDMLKDS